MSCCYHIDGHTDAEDTVFPLPNINLVGEFLASPEIHWAHIPCPRAGINPAILAEMKRLGAKEWFCSYSNRIVPNPEDLSIAWR